MSTLNNEDLSNIIQRYGQVAETVNPREMKRFIEELRKRWQPLPEDDDWRYDGWSDVGAFTKCVYNEAFAHSDLPRRPEIPRSDWPQSELCHAELEGQIQTSPTLDEVMNFVRPALLEPLPQNDTKKFLDMLKDSLREQIMTSGITETLKFELPSELMTLFTTVSGIRAAGVPAETEHTFLVYPLGEDRIGERFTATKLPREIQLRAEKLDSYRHPIAGFLLGGSGEQARSIYYVLTKPPGNTELTNSAS